MASDRCPRAVTPHSGRSTERFTPTAAYGASVRRIYESSAVRRDDEEPHVPNETGRGRPQSFRHVDTGALSRLFVPGWLGRRCISVTVTTPRTEYQAGSTVPILVTMENRMPFPVTLATRSRFLWQWDVDGYPEASHVNVYDVPNGEGAFAFARGEEKRFRRRWDGMFRVSENEWVPADPGEYAIAARINVADAAGEGLSDATTVRLVRE